MFVSFVFVACGGGSQTVHLTPMPTQNPSVGVQLLPASNGVASGAIAPGAQSALAGALSGSGDRSAAGTFATTTIEVGPTASILPASQRRQPQMLHSTAVPSPGPQLEAHASDDNVLQALLHRIPARAPQGIVRRRAESTLPPAPVVGSTVANVWVTKFPIGGGPTTNVSLPMTLEAQSAHGNVWVDNSLIAGPKASHSFSGGAAAQSAAIVAADFEVGYASDTAHFASPDYAANAPGLQVERQTCDDTGRPIGQAVQFIAEPPDRRINVMLLSSISDALGDGVGGLFASENYVPQVVLNCNIPMGMTYKSNEAPMIFVAWTDSAGAPTELTDDQITAPAHELQHLINFVNRALVAPGASDPNSDFAETSTNNEGLAVLAQDFAIHAKYPSVDFDTYDALGLAQTYLTIPQNFSITGFIGIDPGSGAAKGSCRGCYGGAYLFQRYLYDRFGGDAYSHAMETSGLIGFPNLASSCACHKTAQQLLQDFFVAMAANSIGLTPSTLAYRFGTLDVNATYPSPIVQQPSRTLPGLNAVVVPGGATAAASAPLGGAAFFTLQPTNGARAPITIKDTNPGAGFVLTGALVQK